MEDPETMSKDEWMQEALREQKRNDKLEVENTRLRERVIKMGHTEDCNVEQCHLSKGLVIKCTCGYDDYFKEG
jgi:hypothetical protein